MVEMTTTRPGEMRRPRVSWLDGASVCRKGPHPFWTIIALRLMKKRLLTSAQIQRYVLLPAVIPPCHRQQTWWGATLVLFRVTHILSVQRHLWIEFYKLTSHPKTPDRTAAYVGRHVSRNNTTPETSLHLARVEWRWVPSIGGATELRPGGPPAVQTKMLSSHQQPLIPSDLQGR